MLGVGTESVGTALTSVEPSSRVVCTALMYNLLSIIQLSDNGYDIIFNQKSRKEEEQHLQDKTF